MLITNEALGIDVALVPLKQRHIETFALAIKEFEAWPAPAFRGAVLRCAIKGGWIERPAWTPEEVSEMPPKNVRFIADAIATLYTEVMDVNPKA